MKYTVEFTDRVTYLRKCTVEADSEDEAIDKIYEGMFDLIDTEEIDYDFLEIDDIYE